MRLTARLNGKVEDAIFEDVAFMQSLVVFELLATENEALLMSSDAFLLLYARLDGGNGVRVGNLQRDGLASQQLDKNLHIAILVGTELLLFIEEPRPALNARARRRTLPYSAAERWVKLAGSAQPRRTR
jgi:hypothetical protein